ncbi:MULTISPECIES: polysaccharide deacetylase family protein [unclassified Pseudomonas]|uniref:polysaccharide deacetylase family protein n=1 Tax=unclassified Pseudomonas TaxID=196821 RepID=UPI002AC8DAE6|nr:MULTISPECIES: polysaccharide deacetylase family protein [unclassified Pseudomonas]MEB0048305.1 polysaccharide deacetylase family protein [Pseudomonas sp. Dout3]MEB0099055.1 polysaccharide deacetylase family protein [Pseudomonas sp. DC1.2]WPX56955.1 polysaccharide deacetylase family protein [Pseudomonas sp. DC1.2]
MPIKQLLKRTSGWLYLNSPVGRHQLQGAGVILMLHRVLANDRAADLPHRNELCVGPEAFENLLLWLKKHFECVPLMDILQPAALRSERPKVALTFDDGWRDNASNAFPLLHKHQVPASIFLSTDFIGSRQRFWWESLGETLWESHGKKARTHLIECLHQAGRPLPVLLDDLDLNRRSLALLCYLQSLKTLAPEVLDQLSSECPKESQPQALDWQQVRALEASGLVRFGAHGASHAILTGLDDQRLDEELSRSSDALLNGCNQPLPVYCYPNGDHDARVRQHVAAHNFPFALGTGTGIYRGNDDPLALPRFGVSQRTARNPQLLSWRIYRGSRP